MSKLGWQFQGSDGAVAGFVNSEYVKVINPGTENPFPGRKVIMRVHMDEDVQNAMILKGAVGGDELFNLLRPWMTARPWVYAVETWNEPLAEGLFVQAKRVLLAQATVRFLELAHGVGWRVVVGNFSVGQPPAQAWEDFLPIIQAMRPDDMLGLHEYGWPSMKKDLDANFPGEGWLCLRYRKVARWLREQHGMAMPKVFIGECGLDRLLVNVRGGWMSLVSNILNLEQARKQYFDELAWYDDELMKDSYVVAAVPFTAAPNQDWSLYKIDVPLSEMIHNRIATHPTPSTEKAKGFDASKYQTGVNWDLVKRNGFSFCFLRITGANKWPDYTGLEIDPALDSHYRGAGSIGLLRGGYHFLLPDIYGQAAYFANAVKNRPFELPFYGDVEAAGITEEKVRGFLEAADRNLAKPIGIYTNKTLFQSLKMASYMAGRSLWAAQWDVDAPTFGWPWDFHQYTSDGSAQGFTGRLDLNRYKGSAYELQTRYSPTAPAPVPVPIEDGGTMEFFLNGLKVTETEFYNKFKNSFKVVPGASIPRITKLASQSSMAQQAQLVGALDPTQWRMAIDIYGNHFLAEFKNRGGWIAEWTMGHEGWAFVLPGPGAATIYLEKNGIAVGDKVTGAGWFEDHIHANIVWDVTAVADPVEPPVEPSENMTKLRSLLSLIRTKIDEALKLAEAL
jgi:lysozyme